MSAQDRHEGKGLCEGYENQARDQLPMINVFLTCEELNAAVPNNAVLFNGPFRNSDPELVSRSKTAPQKPVCRRENTEQVRFRPQISIGFLPGGTLIGTERHRAPGRRISVILAFSSTRGNHGCPRTNSPKDRFTASARGRSVAMIDRSLESKMCELRHRPGIGFRYRTLVSQCA